MDVMNIFTGDAWTLQSMTKAINDIQPQYQAVGNLGIFTPEPLSQRSFLFDVDAETTTILPATPWGAPATPNKTDKPITRSFAVPHFPIEDKVTAEDIQGIRQVGSVNPATIEYIRGRKLGAMSRKITQTLEWLMLGAIKGTIADGRGTMIYNLFTEFGVSQSALGMALNNSSTDVQAKLTALKRGVSVALRGSGYRQLLVLSSDTFYDALTSHSSVKEAFKYFQTTQQLSADWSGSFQYGGVTFVNYTGEITDFNGATQKMIEDDAAYVIPVGADIFRTYYAPADYIETANTLALPMYAKSDLLPLGKGLQLEAQSNPLPIVLKPKAIYKLTRV